MITLERRAEIAQEIKVFRERWALAKAYREAGVAIIGEDFYNTGPTIEWSPEEREWMLQKVCEAIHRQARERQGKTC